MIMKINVSDFDFEDKVINKSHELFVLVDFWAPWCGPCLMLGPAIEKILDTDEFRKKILLAKANTDECQVRAAEYMIDAIPKLKLFKDGKVISEMTGFRPVDDLINWLRSSLKK